jgi:endonuclease III related protein
MSRNLQQRLMRVYSLLLDYFGPQHWWPAKTPFEVIVGAILTQNTSWINVEKSLGSLRSARVLNAPALYRLTVSQLARHIYSCGYYNIKAKRLKAFLEFFFSRYGGRVENMKPVPSAALRSQLLAVKGIGPETADSILLYAVEKPVFVVDAYTKRLVARHGFAAVEAGYEELQNLFMQNLKNKVQLFNEFHALIVCAGKSFCLKAAPQCGTCPLSCMLQNSPQ